MKTVTHCFGALHVFAQQPVELQVALSLVAGLQPLLDACVDVLDGEDTQGRIIRRSMELLLTFGEHREEHIVLRIDVQRCSQDTTRFSEVSCLQEPVFYPVLHTTNGQRHVGVELAVILAKPDDARGVEEVAWRTTRRHAVLRYLRLNGQKVDETSTREAVHIINIKMGDECKCV